MGTLVLNRKAKCVWLHVINRVLDDAANVGVKEGLAGFVAGLEVEDSACASVEDTAKVADIDLTDKNFWSSALQMIADQIDLFCQLVEG